MGAIVFLTLLACMHEHSLPLPLVAAIGLILLMVWLSPGIIHACRYTNSFPTARTGPFARGITIGDTGGEAFMEIDQGRMELGGNPYYKAGEFDESVRSARVGALHEDLAQLLAACRLNLASLNNEHADDRLLEQRLESLDQLIGKAFTLLRQIAVELYPLGVEEEGLHHALRLLLRSFSEQHGISCKLIAEESNINVGGSFGVSAFRVIQGVLEHIAHHFQASEILVKLRCRAGKLLVSLHHNNPQKSYVESHEPLSNTFRELRERVEELRGRLRVVNVPDHGSRFDISLPLPEKRIT